MSYSLTSPSQSSPHSLHISGLSSPASSSLVEHDNEDWCRQLSALVCLKSSQFHEARDIVMSLIARFKLENEAETGVEAGQVVDNPVEAMTKDLQIVRTKGCSGRTAKRKTQRCSVCRVEGHKRTSCPVQKHIVNCAKSVRGSSLSMENESEDNFFNDHSYSEIGYTSHVADAEDTADNESCADLAADK